MTSIPQSHNLTFWLLCHNPIPSKSSKLTLKVIFHKYFVITISKVTNTIMPSLLHFCFVFVSVPFTQISLYLLHAKFNFWWLYLYYCISYTDNDNLIFVFCVSDYVKFFTFSYYICRGEVWCLRSSSLEESPFLGLFLWLFLINHTDKAILKWYSSAANNNQLGSL